MNEKDKVIPSQKTYSQDYFFEKLEKAFKDSRTAYIFEKDMPPVYESFQDWLNKNNVF